MTQQLEDQDYNVQGQDFQLLVGLQTHYNDIWKDILQWLQNCSKVTYELAIRGGQF